MTISDSELLIDLNRVADRLGKTPTQREYETHGEYSRTALTERYSSGWWEAAVRAGQKPPTSVPLSETDYDSYIQAAINAEYPSVSFYGVLRGFTGIPANILRRISSDWVSRLDSDLQPTLITVPSEHIASDSDWVLQVPTHYTVGGEQKPTGLEPLLRWLNDTDGQLLKTDQSKDGILSNLISEAGLNIEPPALRATVAAHLARRGVSRFEIEMQVGFEKTDWRRSVEDYYLYLYQFEDYCHPDYDPSGVFLDPDSGDVERGESEAN